MAVFCKRGRPARALAGTTATIVLVAVAVLALTALVLAEEPTRLASIDTSYATRMYLDKDTRELFLGEADALRRIDVATLGIINARTIADTSPCVGYNSVPFGSFDGSGASDTGFCDDGNGGCYSECDDRTCTPLYYTSLCTGNQYYAIMPHSSSGYLLVCSSYTQCVTVHVDTLEDVGRADTDEVDRSPQGWHCGYPAQKSAHAFLSGTINDNVKPFCPVWRYGPTTTASFSNPVTVAAGFFNDLSYFTTSDEPPVLFLAGLREEHRDHDFTDSFFEPSNALAEFTKRDPSGYQISCDAEFGCQDGSLSGFSSVIAETPVGDTMLLAIDAGKVNRYFEVQASPQHIYLYFYKSQLDTVRVTRMCREGFNNEIAIVTSSLSCNGENTYFMKSISFGETMAGTWSATEASAVFSEDYMCIYSHNPAHTHSGLNVAEAMDDTAPSCPGSTSTEEINDFPSNDGYLVSVSGMGTIRDVASDNVNGFSVIYLASTTGAIHRVTVTDIDSSMSFAGEYGSAVTSSFLAGSGAETFVAMEVDDGNNTLLALTTDELVVYQLANCSQHTSCNECIDAVNPYCGWCATSNTCTLREECPAISSEFSLQRSSATTESAAEFWLNSFDGATVAGACPAIASYSQATLPVSVETTIVVTVINLPSIPSGASWFCVIDGYDPVTAQVSGIDSMTSEVSCTFSLSALRDGVADYRDDNVIRVAHGAGAGDLTDLQFTVGSPASGPYASATSQNMSVYDCDVRTPRGCSACPSLCGWCVYENTCSPVADDCRDGDAMNFLAANADECPTIESSSPPHVHQDVAGATLFISGTAFAAAPTMADEYVCAFSTPTGLSASSTTGSFINATTVSCPIPADDGSGIPAVGRINRTVTLSFNGAEVDLGGIPQVSLTYYNCRDLAGADDQDCGRCLADTLAPFECGWCLRSATLDQSCDYREACEMENMFLPSSEGDVAQCPAPEIASVGPLKVPITGGTLLTVQGANFGRRASDIASVDVDGVPCVVVAFVVSTGTITCRMDAASLADVTPSATLTLHLESSLSDSYSGLAFVAPTVSSVSPMLAIESGGAIITLAGQNLDAGNAPAVILDGSACTVDSVAATSITCTVEAAGARRRRDAMDNTVCIVFDSSSSCIPTTGGGNPLTFAVQSDPTIADVAPELVPASGSLTLTFTGSGFDAVQAAVVTAPSMATQAALGLASPGTLSESCAVVSATRLACAIPRFGSVGTLVTAMSPMFPVALELAADNSVYDAGLSYTYVLDPVILSVTPSESTPGGLIIIQGEHHDQFPSELTVVVGSAVARIVSRNAETVTVEVPGAATVGLVDVSFALPAFNYTSTKQGNFTVLPAPSSNASTIAAGVGGGAGFIILLVLLAFVVVVRRRRQKEKALVSRMQNLESQVIDVARQGFNELQEGGALDLDTKDISPREFPAYAQRVYFTSLKTHPIPQHIDIRGFKEVATRLQALASSVDFILLFVQALEKQGAHDFSVADRCHVASLLMCMNHGDSDASTQALNALLKRYFDANSKRDLRLMLRRTESVAEKLLTTWLTAGMHHYVVRKFAKPFFNLLQALSAYTFKGPVDAITGAAMYTLNADTLLRERVDFEVHETSVLYLGETYTVRLLSCDAVSQVKDKLKMVLNFQHPHVETGAMDDFVVVDLAQKRALADVDEGSDVVGGWVQLNTLHYYGIGQGATLAVVPMSEAPSGSDTASHRRLQKGRGSKGRLDPFKARQWHLVKKTEANEQQQAQIPSEIFLTYLLTVKAALQPFVDDLIRSMFDEDDASPTMVALFQFLETQADGMEVSDPVVRHVWKSNALPLRFWVNLLKNPEFIFNIDKPRAVNSGLSTIAQVVMDSCSVSVQQLGKHSPANKHLYRKEVAAYKDLIRSFYRRVLEQPSPTPEQLAEEFSHTAATPVIAMEDAAFGLLEFLMSHKDDILGELHEAGEMGLANEVDAILEAFGGVAIRGKHTSQRATDSIGSRGGNYLRIMAGLTGDENGIQNPENRKSVVMDESMFSMNPSFDEQQAVVDGNNRTAASEHETLFVPKDAESEEKYGFKK